MTSKRSSVTLLDVANHSSVSKTTASKALNGHPGLRTETVARVLESARELGFTPNAVARRLGASRGTSARSMMIGFLADRLAQAGDDPYCFRVMVGAQRAAAAVSYHMVLGLSHENVEAQLEYVRRLDNGGVDGWILSDDRVHHQVLDYLAEHEIPRVIVGDSIIVPGVTTIHSDNIGGATLAVQHLLGLGHRRIAFAGWDRTHAWTGMRLTGYTGALQQAGVPCDDRYILLASHFGEFREWLGAFQSDAAPTAIVAATDWIGVELLKVAASLGIGVPGHLSVVGYDNAPWLAPSATPPLSSVGIVWDSIGEAAFRCLHDEIEGKTAPGARIALPVELVIRESTAPPNE